MGGLIVKKIIFDKYFNWLDKKDGATAIEYSLLIAGIAMILTVAAFLMGDEIVVIFANLTAGMAQ